MEDYFSSSVHQPSGSLMLGNSLGVQLCLAALKKLQDNLLYISETAKFTPFAKGLGQEEIHLLLLSSS